MMGDKSMFHMRESLEETLAEFERVEEISLPKEFKGIIKRLDALVRKTDDLEQMHRYFRALLMCIMYWTAIKDEEWSKEITKGVKEGKIGEAYKGLHKLYALAVDTILYINEISMFSDRCMEILLGKGQGGE